MSFQPNCVTIPIDWVRLLEASPTKLPGFLLRVTALVEAQAAAFNTQPAAGRQPEQPPPPPKADADLPLDPPAAVDPPPTPYDLFNAAVSQRLTAEFPATIAPSPAQTEQAYHLTVAQGATLAEAVAATLEFAAKLIPSSQDPTAHMRAALAGMRHAGSWPAIRDEAAAYARLATPAKLDLDRRRENHRLAAEGPPPPPPLPAQDRRRAAALAVLGEGA